MKLHTRKNHFSISFCGLLLTLLFLSVIINAQDKKKLTLQNQSALGHHEVKDDDYAPVSRESQERSPAYTFMNSSILTVQVNVDEYGQNIVGDAANEPSIAVDPTDLNKMVIGWRQFNTVSSNFRQAGYAYTTNGGLNWNFPGEIQSGIFRSDPVLDYDNQGNFYYNSLSTDPDFNCHVFKSVDGGSTWDNGTYAEGGDKQWMTIDKTEGPGEGNIYAYWTQIWSVCYPDFFTRSPNGGLSFEDCISIPEEPFWGTLAVGPGGELYIGGTIGSDFVVVKSSNAQNAGQVINWDMTTVVSLDGEISTGGPNPAGLLGQTWIAVDTSGGPTNGNVYLLCSVDRYSVSDPLDVMFTRSTNGGNTWSTPVRINDDIGTNAYQWFGTMSVAPNGRIDVIWLDTRNDPGGYDSELFYSKSTDGGISWSANEQLSIAFNPQIGWPQQEKMGDYFEMISDINGARLAWAATFNGEQDVYYSYISDTSSSVNVELTSFTAVQNGNYMDLQWITATEVNNFGFEIERKTFSNESESRWNVIAFKNGKGNSTLPVTYYYSDDISSITADWITYRLKQIDYDGTYKYYEAEGIGKLKPGNFMLSQNYPNPFNPKTIIKYQLPVDCNVRLELFDILGREAAVLVNERQSAGSYNVEFDGSNFTSGIYIYKLTAGNFIALKKLVFVK